MNAPCQFSPLISRVLLEDAIATLVQASNEARRIADLAMRAARIDLAVYEVRTKYPEFFKE